MDDTTAAEKGAAYVFTPQPCLVVPAGVTTTITTSGTFDCVIIEDGGTLILDAAPPLPAPLTAAITPSATIDHAGLPDQIPVTETISLAASQGTYRGLLDSGIPGKTQPGFATFTVNRKGRFTGAIRHEGQSYRLGGSFDPQGRFTGAGLHQGHQPLAVVLNLDRANGTGRMTGTVFGRGTRTNFVADRAGSAATGSFNPQTGRYTVELFQGAPGKLSLASVQVTSGYGLVRVQPSGSVRFVGRMGDGTAFSAGGRLSSQGLWPFFIAPHRGNAGFSGIVSFSESETILPR